MEPCEGIEELFTQRMTESGEPDNLQFLLDKFAEDANFASLVDEMILKRQQGSPSKTKLDILNDGYQAHLKAEWMYDKQVKTYDQCGDRLPKHEDYDKRATARIRAELHRLIWMRMKQIYAEELRSGGETP